MLYEAERGDMSIAVVGDAMISRRMALPRTGLSEVELLRSADLSIANLEFLFHDFEHACSGPVNVYAFRSENLSELKWMGITLSTANNHSYDFSRRLLHHTKHLEEHDIRMPAVARPRSCARPSLCGIAARSYPIMSASSTFSDISRAGPARPDFPGRPGSNALRHQKSHKVTPDVFEALHKANRELGYEEHEEVQAQFGFSGRPKPLDKRTALRFLANEFHVAESFTLETAVNRRILRVLASGSTAPEQADWLVYGVHCHERHHG
jgi:hypothetical protein